MYYSPEDEIKALKQKRESDRIRQSSIHHIATTHKKKLDIEEENKDTWEKLYCRYWDKYREIWKWDWKKNKPTGLNKQFELEESHVIEQAQEACKNKRDSLLMMKKLKCRIEVLEEIEKEMEEIRKERNKRIRELSNP